MSTTLSGIDISHWQSGSSGVDVAATGKDFVIVKATQGTGLVDPACDGFVQAAKKGGMKYGVYHFYDADGGSATAQADYFVQHVAGYVGEALLVLDWEDGNTADVATAKAFLDRVYAKTGVKPLIYFNRSVLQAADWSPVAKADYGLWYARYVDELVEDVSPWKTAALWQSTSSGRVNGYGSAVDLDTFYGDGAAWDAYAGKAPTSSGGSSSSGGGTSTPAPKPTPKPTPKPRTTTVDGYWGKGTTSLLQHVLGTAEDGVISSQVKGTWNGNVQGVQWVTANPKGSAVILAVQKKLKAAGHYTGALDGLLGPATIKGLQAHYGTSKDGAISSPSAMVAAMQKKLNAGKF